MQTHKQHEGWLQALTHDIETLLECLPQAWTASLDSIFDQPPPAPTSNNAAIELLFNHTKWLPHTPPQQQLQQDQQHQHGAIQSSPDSLSLSSSTFTLRAATNFLMQPSQTARMESWQQCTESAITLAAPTQPQEETRPTTLAITKALRARVRQVWRLPWENNWKEVLVAPTPAWCGGSRGPRMAHEAGDSLPLWLASLSCIATCCTGATSTGARLLDLHRSFSHQASHHSTYNTTSQFPCSCYHSMCGC